MRSRILRVFALALLPSSVTSCSSNSNCSVCDSGCSNGLVTIGLVLTPPGCGSQCLTQFCPGGCSTDGHTCLGLNAAADGGLGSCIASQLTATQGLLKSGGVAVSRGPSILLATSAALACQMMDDAGMASPSTVAAGLVIDLPPGFGAGTTRVTSGSQLAALTSWSDGGLTRTPATSGLVTVNVNQPGGGLIGTYWLKFGTDAEEGSFTAPACDICVTPP